MPRYTSHQARHQGLYLRTCPVGEAGPGCCGPRSVRAPQGHVFQLDLPQPLEAVQPLAPAGAAGQPCLPHSSPHPGECGGWCERAALSSFLPHSTPTDPPVWEPGARKFCFLELVSTDLLGHSVAPSPPWTHTHACSGFPHCSHTFTSQVSTLWPVRRPSSPWPRDRSRQMLFLQAWSHGVGRQQGSVGGGGGR